MAQLRFFYFDLGNVLLLFDHHKAARQMAEVAGTTSEKVWEVVFGSDLEWRYESGEVSSVDFYRAFCGQTASAPDFDDLQLAAADIFELNVPIVRIVTGLRAGRNRLGILSNTNQAHWQFVSDGRYAIIPRYFEQIALSYEIRSMKPQESIYAAATQLAGVPPQEIFFVDDRPENVAGAREFGFDAVLFTTARQLAQDLTRRGVRFD
jgi:HAD superfamily hydrolase (TIGR01509 family)